MQTAPRPRLDTSEPLFRAVDALAGRLDEGGQDLWAANLRACLHGASSGEVFSGLGFELYRLRQSSAVRRLRLVEPVDELIATVATACGGPDTEHLPLYVALRDLVDLLRLGGGQRWVRELEAAHEEQGSPGQRISGLMVVLERMAPGADGLPPGTSPRVAAVRQRLARARAAEGLSHCLTAALRPPAAGVASD
jgi:hypothetical protein